jgi:hypothetical protein
MRVAVTVTAGVLVAVAVAWGVLVATAVFVATGVLDASGLLVAMIVGDALATWRTGCVPPQALNRAMARIVPRIVRVCIETLADC